MRILIATTLFNSKGNEIYCKAKKVTDEQIDRIRKNKHKDLEKIGFTFIKMISLEHSDFKGYAIFYEGHLDEMNKVLKSFNKSI